MKLVWQRVNRPGHWLQAMMSYDHGAVTPTGLNESHMVPVQIWCEAQRCGRRMSFDLWRFRSEKELTAFLLKWG